MTAHSALCKGICEMLATRKIWYMRTNSHGYGRKGIPDILACVHGRFAAIEAKVLPDKPSPWQRRELEAIQTSWGRSYVAYSIEAAEAFVLSVFNVP